MIKDSQYFLSRLYTEEVYRRNFFSNRQAFYNSENIQDKELTFFLEQLKEEQINFFAKGLLSKRWHTIKNLMPVSTELMKNLEAEFNKFSNDFLPTGVHKHHIDALAFIRYLLKLSMFKDPLIRSVLNFEADIINNFLRPKTWRLKRYYFDPFLIKDQSKNIKRSATLVLWKKGVMRKLF